MSLSKRSSYVPAAVPSSGRAIAESLSMVSITVITACLCRRIWAVSSWRTMPLSQWLLLAIYVDSYLFVFLTGILDRGLGINESLSICSGAISLCLACYMTTKVLIYLFLVERVRIVRGSRKARIKDRMWLCNFIGMILLYAVVVILNFLYRFAYINNEGWCVLGMRDIAIIPLLAFDAVVNIYLTSLFLAPLWRLYSFRNSRTSALRKMALRSVLGSCVTLILSLTNLLVLTILKGEPGWICLLCCNADIIFSVVVLQWITSEKTRLRVAQPHAHYVLQKNSPSRVRGSGENGNGQVLCLSEGQLATQLPHPSVFDRVGQSVESEEVARADYIIGLPSTPMAEDNISNCENKSDERGEADQKRQAAVKEIDV